MNTTVSNNAVMMAPMTEARIMAVEHEAHTSHCGQTPHLSRSGRNKHAVQLLIAGFVMSYSYTGLYSK